MHDLVIRGGTLIDGSGADRRQADVAIEAGRIVAVGEVSGRGHREIDAQDQLVTPGWVDVHTHYDGQATWDPVLAPSSWHGVTTVVMGNCGVGFAPVRPGEQDFLIELMEGVEDIPGSALAEGIDWQWESFPEYLDALERMPRAIDVGTQVPHGAVRAYVMGKRCNTQDDVPTDAELVEMQRLVREGMAAGALGFSSSRTLLHKDKHGIHVPGTFAGSDEMLALGLSMKGLSHGVFELVSDHLGEDDEWTWVKQFARQTGLKVTLVGTSPGAYVGGRIYRMASEAAAEGMEIRPQMAARPTGVLHGLQSNFHVFVGHPTFAAELANLPLADKVARMRDPAMRARLLAEASRIPRTAMGKSLEELLWQVFPLGDVPDYEQTREASVAGMAAARGVPAFEVMYDLLVDHDGKELFYQPLGGYEAYNLDYYREIMQVPNILFGLSDGGAHCGVIADAGMPSYILSYWGRDRRRGERLPLEYLVRKLSRDTAEAYGMDDRGLVAPGMKADLNVIDFDALRLHRPEAVHDLPTGGKRLVQRVEGYRYTIQAGEVTFENSLHTGALPGRLVRGGDRAS
ncbi:MAG: amidohydrolase family protein [Pseudomonadales bacterium]|jgi:N-acyl-D-aspartate/D-glutamate deacylase|nr:amidohydrolase family protein [Pseudomonadales bacterium]